MEILKKLPQWAILLIAVYLAVLVSYAVYDGRKVDFIPPSIHPKVKLEKENVVNRIKSGKEFLVAFSVSNANETNCLKPEKGSPIGDFLVGAVYKVKYNKVENKFYTKGLNQGLAGCPWHDKPDARTGSNLDRKTIILWGAKLKFDERGLVYIDGDHVGYILFPPDIN